MRNAGQRKVMKALAVLVFVLAGASSTLAQGIPGGAQQGYERGNCVAGPIGAVVGAAVGGVIGGLVGGVNGMLGIEQRQRQDERRRRDATGQGCEPPRR